MTAISVVMGVHNGGATLAATIDSILAQTELDFELIVVDDGSTDETPRVLADSAARDPRVRVLTQQNQGLTRALIAGCAAARGALIARHDAGDLSDPQRLALQKRAIEEDDVVFVSCATQYVGPELEPLYVEGGSGAALAAPIDILDLDDPRILRDGPTHHGSVMFRRDAYERAGGYRAAFYYGQDFDLWYRLAQIGKFRAVAEVLYTARLHPDSITAAARRAQDAIGALSRQALYARVAGRSDDDVLARAAAIRPKAKITRRARAGSYYFIGETLRRNGDARAPRYLRRAIAEWPFSPRPWVRLAMLLLYHRRR
jgi:glycosyltransferase involved in cell wall biosynthesis